MQLDQNNKPVEWGERGVNDEVVLVSYRLTVGELGAFAPSRLQVQMPEWMREDSDIERDETGALNLREQFVENSAIRRDGYVLVAVKADDTDGTQQYSDTFNDVDYDTPYAMNMQRGGDAGLKAITRAKISGKVWEDANNDGVRQEGERGIAGVPVQLTRYWYHPTERYWVYDEAFNDAEGDLAYQRNLATDANGDWLFEELEATGLEVHDEEELDVIYGYRVHVLSVPGNYGISPINRGGNAEVDSDLNEANTRLMPDEPVNGLIVLAQPRQDGEPDERVISVGPGEGEWSMAAVEDSEHNDAGLVPFSRITVNGVVFNDAAQNGVLDTDDQRLEGMEVWLERTITSADDAMDAGWLSRIGDGVAGSSLDDGGEPLVAGERYYDTLPSGIADQLARDHDANGPAKPEQPEAPEQPEQPAVPGEPDEPEVPVDPDEPEVPVDPDEPETPVDPDEGDDTEGEGSDSEGEGGEGSGSEG